MTPTPYLRFLFPWFQLPTVNHGLTILNGNFKHTPFVSFKLRAVLRSVMKSHTIPWLPARDINHPFVQLHTLSAASHLEAVSVIR